MFRPQSVFGDDVADVVSVLCFAGAAGHESSFAWPGQLLLWGLGTYGISGVQVRRH